MLWFVHLGAFFCRLDLHLKTKPTEFSIVERIVLAVSDTQQLAQVATILSHANNRCLLPLTQVESQAISS